MNGARVDAQKKWLSSGPVVAFSLHSLPPSDTAKQFPNCMGKRATHFCLGRSVKLENHRAGAYVTVPTHLNSVYDLTLDSNFSKVYSHAHIRTVGHYGKVSPRSNVSGAEVLDRQVLDK